MRGGGWKRDLRTLYATAKYQLSNKDVLEFIVDSLARKGLNETNLSAFLRDEEEAYRQRMSKLDEKIVEKNASIKQFNKRLAGTYDTGQDWIKDFKDRRKKQQDEVAELNKQMNQMIKDYELMKKAAQRFINIPVAEVQAVERRRRRSPTDEEIQRAYRGAEELSSLPAAQATRVLPVIDAMRVPPPEPDQAMLRAMEASMASMDEDEQSRSGRGLSRGKNVGIMRRIVRFR